MPSWPATTLLGSSRPHAGSSRRGVLTAAENVLRLAVRLGGLMQANYSLLRIYGPVVVTGLDPQRHSMGASPKPSVERLRVEAEDYLKGVVERLKAKGCSAQTHAWRPKRSRSRIKTCCPSSGPCRIMQAESSVGGSHDSQVSCRAPVANALVADGGWTGRYLHPDYLWDCCLDRRPPA
jgi:hypothetical protein